MKYSHHFRSGHWVVFDNIRDKVIGHFSSEDSAIRFINARRLGHLWPRPQPRAA